MVAHSTAFYTDPAGPTYYQNTPTANPIYPDKAGYLATEITITLGNFLRTSFEDLLPYGSYGITKKAKNKVVETMLNQADSLIKSGNVDEGINANFALFLFFNFRATPMAYEVSLARGSSQSCSCWPTPQKC